MAHQLEAGRAEQVGDVRPPAGEVVVDAEHLVALRDQPVAEMAAEKARSAGHQDTLRHHAAHDRGRLSIEPEPLLYQLPARPGKSLVQLREAFRARNVALRPAP